ncbi:MAG TPA: conjugal transfer protein [Solirubrobacterales bacterium]|nr:conjugal transfer protein [Solirubrobacterales bacterium]
MRATISPSALRGAGHSLRLRRIGRVALWALVALLLIRGTESVLSPAPEPPQAPAGAKGSPLGQASTAFAVGFARAYLAEPSLRNPSDHFAEGVTPNAGGGTSGREVAQAEVAQTRRLSGGRAIVTVACELLGGRVLYLAVPIVRDSAGEVAALGAPSLVAAPETAGLETERTQPLSGADAGAIGELVDRFLAAYASTSEPADLSYYVAPGTSVTPIGGLRLIGTPNVREPQDEGGPDRTVIASVRAHDEASDVTYFLSYRLELVRHERWYVSGVEGALR